MQQVPDKYEANETLRDAYSRGWNYGHGIACHNVPAIGHNLRLDSMGRVTVDADNIREVHESLCYEAETQSRDFSPFEFIAHRFNSLDEESDKVSSDEAWEAFEEGIGDAISADLSTYTDEDYGIES